jgi:hypothetical protein
VRMSFETNDDGLERFLQWVQMFQIIIYSALYLIHIHALYDHRAVNYANTGHRQY